MTNPALLAPAVLLCWLGLAHLVLGLRHRRRDPAMLALCLGAAAITVNITQDLLAPAIDRAVGVAGVAEVVGDCSVLVAAGAGQAYLIMVGPPGPAARRRARTRYAVLASTLAVMLAIFVVAPGPVGSGAGPGGTARPPYGSLYTFLYCAYLGTALLGIVRGAWRYSRLTDQAFLRLGLRIVAAACVCGLGYTLLTAFFQATRDLRLDATRWEAVLIPALYVPTSLLILAGIAAPSWGPWLDPVAQLARDWRSLRRLHPLWRALHRAVPGVALAPPSPPLADALDPRDVRFRLHRRAIEIRDCQLALRRHVPPGAADLAVDLCRRAGLAGVRLEATVEAAELAAALRARVRGEPPACGQAASSRAPICTDPADEVAWLERVAAAFASPVVARVLDQFDAVSSSGLLARGQAGPAGQDAGAEDRRAQRGHPPPQLAVAGDHEPGPAGSGPGHQPHDRVVAAARRPDDADGG